MFLKNWYKIVFGMMSGAGMPLQIKDTSGTARNFAFNSSPAQMIYFSVYDILKKWTTNPTNDYGVVFGNGDTPVTMDDYKLAGSIVTGCTVTLANGSSCADDGVTIEKTFSVSNTGNADITIKEVGIVHAFYYSSTAYKYALVERTVLDSPVTIPAGGFGQVIYRISAPFPTA